MNENVAFYLDDDLRQQMMRICDELGISISTAFCMFARAFVEAKGMPFPAIIQKPESVPPEQMMGDAQKMMNDFSGDYKRMAK